MSDDVKVQENSVRKVFQSYFSLLLILWILFVLYPNPLNLVISIQRVFSFDVDTGVVEPLVDDFPSAPPSYRKDSSRENNLSL